MLQVSLSAVEFTFPVAAAAAAAFSRRNLWKSATMPTSTSCFIFSASLCSTCTATIFKIAKKPKFVAPPALAKNRRSYDSATPRMTAPGTRRIGGGRTQPMEISRWPLSRQARRPRLLSA
jgi:hypothetical protein